MKDNSMLTGRVRHSTWYRNPHLGHATFSYYDQAGALHVAAVKPHVSRDELFADTATVLVLANLALTNSHAVNLSWAHLQPDEAAGRDVTVIEHRLAVQVVAVFAVSRVLVVCDATADQASQVFTVSADTVTAIGLA